jgi:predicted RNA-binding protein with TRAM domain
MKHIPIGEIVEVEVHRKGQSGDYIAYPKHHSPSEYDPEDGIHLKDGTRGETVQVEILSTRNGFIEAKPRMSTGLDTIWKDIGGDHIETAPQQSRGQRYASDADPTKRHREFMREQSRRHR